MRSWWCDLKTGGEGRKWSSSVQCTSVSMKILEVQGHKWTVPLVEKSSFVFCFLITIKWIFFLLVDTQDLLGYIGASPVKNQVST